jgi:hypothetical protein
MRRGPVLAVGALMVMAFCVGANHGRVRRVEFREPRSLEAAHEAYHARHGIDANEVDSVGHNLSAVIFDPEPTRYREFKDGAVSACHMGCGHLFDNYCRDEACYAGQESACTGGTDWEHRCSADLQAALWGCLDGCEYGDPR